MGCFCFPPVFWIPFTPEAGRTSSVEWLQQWRSSPQSQFLCPSRHLASECAIVLLIRKTWAVLHLSAMKFGHLAKLRGCFFFVFFYRGDNDEEEPSKLKVEHHGLSVTGLQSPGKLHGRDFGKMYCYLLRWRLWAPPPVHFHRCCLWALCSRAALLCAGAFPVRNLCSLCGLPCPYHSLIVPCWKWNVQ